MMRWFRYADQDGVHVVSANYILDRYGPYWKAEMKARGKESLISDERCIEDFCVVNWATEISPKE